MLRRAVVAMSCLVGACGPGAREVPAPSIQEDPGEHVRRISHTWQEASLDEGHLEQDPNGVARYRIATRLRVELFDDGRSAETISRDEVFQMADGREFHCTTEGTLAGRARYRREHGEIRIDLSNPAAALRRRCSKPGFPVLVKEVPAAAVTFVLRGERLVAVHPPELRATLFPWSASRAAR